MNHICGIITTVGQAREFFEVVTTRDAGTSARNTLVQIYVGHADEEWIARIVEAIHQVLPHAVIVGATSAGEISAGCVSHGSTLISASFFESSDLYPIALACAPGSEFETGGAIAESLRAIPDLRGVLLLAPTAVLNCALVLDGIEDRLPGLLVFGGGAASIQNTKRAYVFHQSAILESGCVAVGLGGAGLHIETHVFLGWKGFGPEMTLTDVEGFDVRTIDGGPAIEVYRKYLAIGPNDEDLYLLEFPLLIERHGMVLARNPVSSGAGGCVTLVADIYQGETARLGHLDVDSVVENVRGMFATLESFSPDAIFLYSCVCRLFTLQQDVEIETQPFQAIAPVAGFLRMASSAEPVAACRISIQVRLPLRCVKETSNPRCRARRPGCRLIQPVIVFATRVSPAGYSRLSPR